MSKTPRTDEHLRMKEENGHTVRVSSEFARQLERELADKDRQLAEARADAAHWKSECNALQRMVHEARAETDGLTLMATNASMEPAKRLIQKNKELHAVIEQMREALRLADDLIDEYAADYEHRDNVDEIREQIKAALAAERGE